MPDPPYPVELLITGKQQQTGSGPVQSVAGKHMLAAIQLTCILQGKPGSVAVNRAAMHQQPGRLVHSQQPAGRGRFQSAGWALKAC